MLSPSHQPVIGVTLDREPAGGYSKFPWYAVRENYMCAVLRAGGLPVALPHDDRVADQYMDLVDGILITGGAFDVDPELFGQSRHNSVTTVKQQRTVFELAITRTALVRDVPILGICGGEQLLNVALGGSLIQHIPEKSEGTLAHEQPNSRDQAGHSVRIMPGTFLHDIVGADEIEVNSAHHQAVAEVGPAGIIIALAPDGIIEGIEEPAKRFCVGVQWHPEFHVSPGDSKLFAAFVSACRG